MYSLIKFINYHHLNLSIKTGIINSPKIGYIKWKQHTEAMMCKVLDFVTRCMANVIQSSKRANGDRIINCILIKMG